MKILIADTLTLTKEDKIYGHFNKTAKQFLKILSERYTVKIAGGKTYASYFDEKDIYFLPFYTTKQEFDSTNRIKKCIRTFKSVINVFAVLLSDADIIIFQDCIQTLLYKILKNIHTKKKIVLIKYAIDERKKSNEAFEKIKDKISAIITSLDEVAEFYKINALIVPDYFPSSVDTKKEENISYLQDFSIVGTVMKEKDYEMVIKAINGTKYSLLIAGYFPDKKYKEKLEQLSGKNIRIIDAYLSEKEYDYIIKTSRFVILPYKKGYDLKSSGVVLDSLYREVPVIVPNLKSFSFVSNKKLGLQYNSSVKECLKNIDGHESLKENIRLFIKEQNEAKGKLLAFIGGLTDDQA